ncbi:MAG: hypothetical protein CK425_04845 [Parachlamydia sp.]|nr:MAG: hypothetical protein CK425_04845 [Parachlamydia sp.]
MEDLLPHQWKPRDPTKVLLLHGLNGMGKSELALYFANLHRYDYFTYIHTFHFGNEAQLYQEYLEAAKNLGLSIPEGLPMNELKNKFHSQLENYLKGPWLLILDNVNQKLTKEDFPQNGGVVLITSIDQSVWEKSQANALEVKEFTLDEATSVLSKVTGEEKSEDMRQLALEVGCFPFAVYQIASYIAGTPGRSIADYRAIYNSQKKPHRARLSDNERLLDVLETIWDITFQEIKKNELAQEWLNVATYLYPKHITKQLLEDWIKAKHPEHSGEAADRVFRLLGKYGLMRLREDRQSFSLHALLQRVLKHKQGDAATRQKIFEESFDFIYDYLSNVSTMDIQTWEKGKKCLPHLANLLENKYVGSLPLEKYLNGLLLASNLSITSFIGDCKGALKYAERGLEVCGSLDETRAPIAFINFAYHKGIALMGLSDSTGALVHFLLAMLTFRDLDHSRYPIEVIHNVFYYIGVIGIYFSSLGAYKEAAKTYSLYLKTLQKIRGDKDLEMWAQLHLGLILARLGKLNDGYDKVNEILEFQKQECEGKDHLRLKEALRFMGVILIELGDYEEARRCLKKALEMGQRLYKEAEGPELALDLNNYGKVLGKLGKHKKSKKFLLSGLEMIEKIRGKSDLLAGLISRNVGEVLSNLDNPQQALEYARNSLRMFRRVYKNIKHPEKVRSLNVKGSIYRRLGNPAKALNVNHKALRLAQEIYGEKPHYDLGIVWAERGETLHHLTDLAGAIAAYEKALSILKIAYQREDHPNQMSIKQKLKQVHFEQTLFTVAFL